MDKYEHSTRQYKTTDTSPELRKARCGIARALDLLKTKLNKINTNIVKRLHGTHEIYYWIKGSSKRLDCMIKSITVEIITLFIDGL